jgi:hypothetical protein
MTLQDYEDVKVRIKPIVERWVGPLGLKRWRTLDICYDNQFDKGSQDCVASADVSWHYEEAVITFYMPACVGKPDDELEYAFLHELGHVFLSETRPQDGKEFTIDQHRHEDRVCTQLAQAFMWVRDFAVDGKLPKVEVKEA